MCTVQQLIDELEKLPKDLVVRVLTHTQYRGFPEMMPIKIDLIEPSYDMNGNGYVNLFGDGK